MADGLLKSTQNLNKSKEQETKGEEQKQNTSVVKVSRNQFWSAVQLLLEKPHVINRKICGYYLLWLGKCQNLTPPDVLTQLNSHIQKNSDKLVSVITVLFKNNFEKIERDNLNNDNTIPWEQIGRVSLLHSSFAIVRNVIPKHLGGREKLLEVIIIDGPSSCVHFLSEPQNDAVKVLPQLNYTLSWVDHSVVLNIWEESGPELSGSNWLKYSLLPCLTRWASQMNDEDDTIQNIKKNSSLKLVDIVEYNTTYQKLKQKYGTVLIESWKESTDPLKYIYEDIAIASYLLVLWAKERKEKNLSEKQSFLDLGCGNGLLVYLLTMEGHTGMGVDIKRRKIWDDFPDIKLKEEVIEPSDKYLYPEYDWLIGNHSDELTPWLPVIAAKSGIANRFFVIPCCAHDFHTKFQRKRTGISQYAEYLDYIQHIGTVCGFKVLRDKLRIPSTKRVCFIGETRTYEESDWNRAVDRIDKFIKSKCSASLTTNVIHQPGILTTKKLVESGNVWCKDFKAREAVQKVRNCTHLKDGIREKLLKDIAFILLNEQNFIKIQRNNEEFDWNRGGSISMEKLVNIMGSQLSYLKNECGGLQTLLRNHRFIFVLKNGEISLRVPESTQRRTVAKELLKTKYCWFHQNHPQGCTLTSENCSYMH